MEVKPQPGPQEMFLTTDADIAIYGGAAGGGKSFGLLLDAARYGNIKSPFPYTIFRRQATQIRNPGGLYDEACRLYLPAGAIPNSTQMQFQFQSGLRVKLAGLEQEDDIYNWQGSQNAAIGFDELPHFTEKQFFYMISRVRSTSGLGGTVRATCNPDPDSWVRVFLDWWIDKDGYPIPERACRKRWFMRENNTIVWFDHKVSNDALSVTFIPAKLADNQILMRADPKYRANLMAQTYVDRMRLLEGNWNIKEAAGLMFKRHWFRTIEECPTTNKKVRYWDRASTPEDPNRKSAAYTAGCLMEMDANKEIFISDFVRFRGTPLEVQEGIKNTAALDGKSVTIGIAQDPGQAGVADADHYVRLLVGYTVRKVPETKDKVTRAKPLSAYTEAKKVYLKRAEWNKPFVEEAEGFPDSKFKDQVDAASGAFNLLTTDGVGTFTTDMANRGAGKTHAPSMKGPTPW